MSINYPRTLIASNSPRSTPIIAQTCDFHFIYQVLHHFIYALINAIIYKNIPYIFLTPIAMRMTQWGSKNLGDKGLSAIQILRSFYGPSMYINTAEKVSGIPSSWPGYILQIGSTGEDVKIIQRQLNAIANNYPALPKLKVDGIYGPKTAAAVKKFQEVFRMPISGKVNYPTWYRISDIYVAVSRLAELQ